METLQPHLDYRRERLQSEAATRRQAAEVVASGPERMATVASAHRRMHAVTAAAVVTGLLLMSGLLATSLSAPASSVAASDVRRAPESERVASPIDDGLFITSVPAGGATGGAKPR